MASQDDTSMDEIKKPLSDVKNVATVKPVSRLPGLSSKLPTPGSRLSKRKAEECDERNSKKQRSMSGSSLGSSTTTDNVRRNLSVTSLDTSVVRGPIAQTSRSQSTSRNKPNTSRARPSACNANDRPPKPVSAAKVPAATMQADKKRPSWDLKGRLQDMEKINGQLSVQNNINDERLAALEALSHNLKGTVNEKEQVLSSATKEIEELESKLRSSRNDLEESQRTLNRKIEDLEFDKSSLERKKLTLENELNITQLECSGLKASVTSLSSSQAGLSAELTSTKMLLEKIIQENKDLKDLVTRHEETLKEQDDRLRSHETERRVLHNTIQELKGNIRVFCRVRPLIGDELLGVNGEEFTHINFPDIDSAGKVIELNEGAPNESCTGQRKGSNNVYEFTFDHVFPPKSTQSVVYEEISQLVQSALDGYHVCLFAYGQTGSGKTFTMEGPPSPDLTTEGMIPRAVQQVFTVSESLADKGWKYDMDVSFLEIYNETIRDLLGSGQEDMKHEIKMTAANSSEVMVTNLRNVKVNNPTQVYKLLSKASENRAVAETKCNSRSSRSHSVFQMKICGHNSITDEKCVGLLNLIDLAGSERLKESGSQGQRLKETLSINKSLSNLGNVIMALANKDPHVPYRNSKLTHLLQHCLGGNSKVLMFVNVSPREECFNETLNSLRFATKVNNCNIGTAQKKIK